MERLLLSCFGYSEDINMVDIDLFLFFGLLRFLLFIVAFQLIEHFLFPKYSFIMAYCITEIAFAGSCSAGFEMCNNGCPDCLSTVVTRPGFSNVMSFFCVSEGVFTRFVDWTFIVELFHSLVALSIRIPSLRNCWRSHEFFRASSRIFSWVVPIIIWSRIAVSSAVQSAL